MLPISPPVQFDDVSDEDTRGGDTPPDGGYGWVCVAACFTINCFTWGAVSAYGIYLSHYLADDIFPEASTWDYAFIGGLNFATAMLLAPFITVLCRKLGTHTTMCIGLLLQLSGFLGASFSTRIWQLHISQGVLIGVGIGFLYIPCLPVLSQWFDKKKSLANGISAAGSGAGGAAFAWGPLCVEVAGIKNLQSLLSLSWAAVVIPATVSEGIALKLRRPGSSREYLYTQIFASLSYIIASGFMFQLRRVKQRQAQQQHQVQQ
ncbi:unnamed protein product [Alternaria alternata]